MVVTGVVLPDHVVLPGQVWFGRGPAQASTLLGSCVAITLWHPIRQAGGMCHYMLPERPPHHAAPTLDGRYGDEALQLLMRAATQAGCPPEECEVKLFGGGRMFGCEPCVGVETLQVHLRNVDQAHRLAERHRLRVVAHHLGGEGHRQLRLHVATGDVWMRFSPRAASAQRCQ